MTTRRIRDGLSEFVLGVLESDALIDARDEIVRRIMRRIEIRFHGVVRRREVNAVLRRLRESSPEGLTTYNFLAERRHEAILGTAPYGITEEEWYLYMRYCFMVQGLKESEAAWIMRTRREFAAMATITRDQFWDEMYGFRDDVLSQHINWPELRLFLADFFGERGPIAGMLNAATDGLVAYRQAIGGGDHDDDDGEGFLFTVLTGGRA